MAGEFKLFQKVIRERMEEIEKQIEKEAKLEYAEAMLEEEIELSKVEKITGLPMEKIEEIQKAVKERQRQTAKAVKKVKTEFTEALLNKGMSIKDITDVTGLSMEEIEQIQQDMLVL